MESNDLEERGEGEKSKFRERLWNQTDDLEGRGAGKKLKLWEGDGIE